MLAASPACVRTYIPVWLNSCLITVTQVGCRDMNRSESMSADRGLHLPQVLGPAEVAALVQGEPRVRLLDVRTAGEYESAHIRGAYNVPLDTLGEHSREIRAAVQDPLVLVCQSGQRSGKAEEALRSAGLENLRVLDGGMNAWAAAGLPVVQGRKRLSLERQVRIAAGVLAATGGLLAAIVHPAFGWLAAFVGGGLTFAGITDTCGMAMLLAKLPYNRATCDVGAAVRALSEGRAAATASSPLRTSGTCCN
jgi:rhodanese-related sulfurtransferase